MHSRFEHLLGVYHVAGEVMDYMKRSQGNELELEPADFKIELEQISRCSTFLLAFLLEKLYRLFSSESISS